MKNLLLVVIIGAILFLSPSYVLALNQNSLNPSAAPQASSQVVGSDPNILVYADGLVFPAPNTIVDQALQGLDMNYTAFYNGNFAGFEAALATKPRCVIFDDQDYRVPQSTYNALDAYVASGGKLVMTSWLVHQNPEPLWFTLGVDQGSAVEVHILTSMYVWDSTNALFTTPNAIPSPLVQTTPSVWGVHAITEKLINGAYAVGGITSSPADGKAFIVIANNGRTLLNTFLLDEVRGDGNGNGLADAVDMMENEILFVCLTPAGGELVGSSALNIGNVLPSIFLASMAAVAAITVSLTVRKRVKV
jgi:hypothetical protein